MRFQFNDGGRYRKGWGGDCVTRAIAIALEKPYREVEDALKILAMSERITKRRRTRSSVSNGVHRVTYERYLKAQGWTWTPTMHIGQGCTVHMRAEELPSGRLIVSLSRHMAAVVDGVLHDLSDCTREGTRCVYGIWRKP